LLPAGVANIITFPATADAPWREKEIKCYPLESGYWRKHICHPQLFISTVTHSGLSRPGVMHRAAHDRLIPIDITVPDFKIETAIRIGANPGFKLYGRSLTAEIG
jgi:hypothetical protein